MAFLYDLFDLSYISEVKAQEYFHYDDGNSSFDVWYREGLICRDDDLPAFIRYDENKNVKSEQWFKQGYCHRGDGLPAYICYNENGDITTKHWLISGSYSRNDDLPVIVNYYANGKTKLQAWCTGYFSMSNVKLHREGGPAVIEYTEDGVISNQEWWSNGKKALNIKAVTASEIGCVGELCSISFDVFEENDKVIRLNCKHIFKEDEIRHWVTVKSSCPYCRCEI